MTEVYRLRLLLPPPPPPLPLSSPILATLLWRAPRSTRSPVRLEGALALITITIITKNETRNLQRLLPNLTAYASRADSLLSEILVLDSGSSDSTESVARSFAVSWHTRAWNGYGPQKRAASSLARNDWILNLDADEVPDDSFWEGLHDFFRKGRSERAKAAALARDFVLFGRVLRHGGAAEQRRTRLFDRRYFDWNDAAVHEDVVAAPGKETVVDHIAGRVLHFSWESTSAFLRRTDERADVLGREKLASEGSTPVRGVRVGTRFFLEFARSYFFRLGFLDGTPGFVFCYFMAFAQALKLIKAYELDSARRRSI